MGGSERQGDKKADPINPIVEPPELPEPPEHPACEGQACPRFTEEITVDAEDTGVKSSDSYLDFNVSGGGKGLGVTGGLYLDAKHRGCGYVGGGLMTPGIGLSATSSKSGVTKGWNFALQAQAGLAVQVGWAGGSFYWEGGIGFPPGANLTAFYVGCVD